MFKQLKECIKQKVETYLVLPSRLLRIHLRDCRRLKQKCKACGQSDGFNFFVPNEIWQAVVPEELRNRVVCLKCFDEFACEREINYSTSLSHVCFAGKHTGFEFQVVPVTTSDS